MSDGLGNMNFSQPRRHSGTVRSFRGCWTCRVRRKKCDESHPVCDACAALHITCCYDQDKPEWMDGGVKQKAMIHRLKREIRENAPHRRGERALQRSGDRVSAVEATTAELTVPTQNLLGGLSTPISDGLQATEDPTDSNAEVPRGAAGLLSSKDGRQSLASERPDTILLMFYLEHVFPFLFPFYRPSPLQGGRSWILEMMMSSPVVREATLCQSSYFFSLAQGTADREELWEKVLAQTRNAFEVLRQALQFIDGEGVAGHLHGAVRIMASIMQLQRFEIAVLSFNNCRAHLNAALALFEQLLENFGAVEPAGFHSTFDAVMNRLGPSSLTPSAFSLHIPSSEGAAFRFSSALLILDDIIAATVLQDEPILYQHHRSLLGNGDGNDAPINLEAVIGCQNWVLLNIGEICMLDAWKKRSKKAGNLNVMELVHRATAIKDTLEGHLTRLDIDPAIAPTESNSLLNVMTGDCIQQSKSTVSQSSLVTRVWAHAALLYLYVVVSGWQPASFDSRYHVGRIIELLTRQISPPALLRTMVWPFCVAGCLAEPAQEDQLRGMVEALQPPGVFGTVRKALEIMESVWRNKNAADAANRDLATCFRSQGDLVLFV